MTVEFAPTLADAVLAVLIVAAVSWIMNGRFRALEAQIAANAAAINRLREEVQAGDRGLREQVQATDRGLREEVQATDRGLREQVQATDRGLREELKTDIRALETRMNAKFEQVDKRFEQIEAQLLRLWSEVAAARSDITQVALAVGARAQPRPGRA